MTHSSEIVISNTIWLYPPLIGEVLSSLLGSSGFTSLGSGNITELKSFNRDDEMVKSELKVLLRHPARRDNCLCDTLQMIKYF